jgi:methylated-DNA-protein-cysteine methyltransferase-like protein
MDFEDRVKALIRSIPRGRVATYAQIASLAGNYRAARQVARVLHASSEKERLPWHRIINSQGGISLARGRGFEAQRRLLRKEGVSVDRSGRVDLGKFQWEPPGLPSRAARDFLRRLTAGECPPSFPRLSRTGLPRDGGPPLKSSGR